MSDDQNAISPEPVGDYPTVSLRVSAALREAVEDNLPSLSAAWLILQRLGESGYEVVSTDRMEELRNALEIVNDDKRRLQNRVNDLRKRDRRYGRRRLRRLVEAIESELADELEHAETTAACVADAKRLFATQTVPLDRAGASSPTEQYGG